LKTEGVWKYFAEISKIPRGSKNEKQIAVYVMQKAKEFGLEAKQDKFMTVVVRKPASPGYENRPMVCLQGHLDMVCEKNKDKVHDFEKDPIELVRNGNVMMANGTTLGADNGVAVATNLAIMEDKSLVHGPLEFLFTIDEETGLTGATNLKPGFVQSKILMNLDSEEEGELYVGCSGGKNTTGVWKVIFENAPGNTVAAMIRVKGLKGGHSGLEIDKGRGNSLKILNRTLIGLSDLGVRIANMEGGNKSNAIPREAEALVYIPKAKLAQAKKVVGAYQHTTKAELATVEPDLAIELEVLKNVKNGKVIKKQLQALVLKTIAGLPHGVIKMSAEIPGLVETSTNVAVLKTEKKKITLITSQRSSVASEIQEVCQTVACVFELGGAKVERGEGYPGWKPNPDSGILRLMLGLYKKMFGKEPLIKAIHAGLECGILGGTYPKWDMISIGPTIVSPHSPDEKTEINSVKKFWDYLVETLKSIPVK